MNDFPTRLITIKDEPLCEECKELGYCKETWAMKDAYRNAIYNSSKQINENDKIMSLKKLLQLVSPKTSPGSG